MDNIFSSHSYTFYFEKGDHKKKISKLYETRNNANEKMYIILGRYGLKINKVWDDKHCKTYFCNDGSVFHINRV